MSSELIMYDFSADYDPGLKPIEVVLPFDAREAIENVACTPLINYVEILEPHIGGSHYLQPIDRTVDSWVATIQDCLGLRESTYVSDATDEDISNLEQEVRLLRPYSQTIGMLRLEVEAQAEASKAKRSWSYDVPEPREHEIELLLTDRESLSSLTDLGETIVRSNLERILALAALKLRGIDPVIISDNVRGRIEDMYDQFSRLLDHYNEHGLIVPPEIMPFHVSEALPNDVRHARGLRQESFVGVSEKKRRTLIADFFRMLATDSQTREMAGIMDVYGLGDSRKTAKY